MTDELNEITFCDECPYSGEPNGCNRKEGICKAHDYCFDLRDERDALKAENKRLKSEKTCKNMSDKNPVDEFVCSKCGFMTDDFYRLIIDEDDGEHINYEYEIKYCPNCGAKVEDEE